MNTFTDTKHCWIRDSSARNIGEFTFCMCDTYVFCVTETQTYRNMKIKTTSTQWRRLFCQFPLGISSSITFWSLSKNVGTHLGLLHSRTYSYCWRILKPGTTVENHTFGKIRRKNPADFKIPFRVQTLIKHGWRIPKLNGGFERGILYVNI